MEKRKKVKKTAGSSIPTSVTADNYHPDSIRYMKKALGRTPTSQEAKELDQKWASNKLSTTKHSMTTSDLEKLMAESPGGTPMKRDLNTRQFKEHLSAAIDLTDNSGADYYTQPKSRKFDESLTKKNAR